jgi:hypothetical protein
MVKLKSNNIIPGVALAIMIGGVMTMCLLDCNGKFNGPKIRLMPKKMVCVGLIVREEGSRNNEHDVEYFLLQDDSGFIKHAKYDLDSMIRFHDTVMVSMYEQNIFDGKHIFIDTVKNLK